MHTKAMSTGFSLASCCASVTCSARTATENSATSLACVTRKPCFRICSTCSGQGSMNVTSSPACTIWAPAYPPTAPAPTMTIFPPMLSSRHLWEPRVACRPGRSQRYWHPYQAMMTPERWTAQLKAHLCPAPSACAPHCSTPHTRFAAGALDSGTRGARCQSDAPHSANTLPGPTTCLRISGQREKMNEVAAEP